MVRLLLILVAGLALAPACGGEPRPALGFSLEVVPERPVDAYGAVVPLRFVLTSECPQPAVVERVDGMTGRRHELASFRRMVELPVRREGDSLRLDPAASGKSRFAEARALLVPGGELVFTLPYRAIAPEVEVVIIAMPVPAREIRGSWWIPDGSARGLWHLATPLALDAHRTGAGTVLIPAEGGLPDVKMAAAVAKLEVPPPPFPRPPDLTGPWSFSRALGGYVVRRGPERTELYREDGVVPLPDTSFEFLLEVDAKPAGEVRVRLRDGTVRAVAPGELAEFLAGARRQGLGVRRASDDADAAWRLAP